MYLSVRVISHMTYVAYIHVAFHCVNTSDRRNIGHSCKLALRLYSCLFIRFTIEREFLAKCLVVLCVGAAS